MLRLTFATAQIRFKDMKTTRKSKFSVVFVDHETGNFLSLVVTASNIDCAREAALDEIHCKRGFGREANIVAIGRVLAKGELAA